MAEHASDETVTVAEVRDLLRRAVLTLAAVPDPDGRFLAGRTTWWPEVVRDVREAYGYSPPRVRRFAPTPHDVQVYLDVLSWLAWYARERDGERARLVIAWAMDVPMWRMAVQFRKTERTLNRWLNEVAEAIVSRFSSEVRKILLDECPKCPSFSTSNQYEGNCDSPSVHPFPSTPNTWIADGEKPSADETIPAVGEDRARLVKRIERGNAKRKRATKRGFPSPRK